MRIKAMRVQHFKGVFDDMQDIGQHTLFVGPNGSGKTARLEAIRYAITGKTSAGDKPDAVMAFASHPTGCAVDVSLDDDFRWARRCIKEMRTKRTTTEVSVCGTDGGLREADAAVAEHVGRFAPMFNIGAFLDLSADKRRDFILRLCGSEAQGERDLVADITAAYFASAMGPGTWDAVSKLPEADRRAAVQDQIGTKRLDAANALMLAAGEVMTHDDIATNLAEALAVLKLATSNNKKAADQGTAAARKLADRRAELEIGSETAEALGKRVADLDMHRRQLRDDIATVKGRADGIAAAKKQIADVDERLAAIRDTLAEAMTFDLDEADKELAEVRTACDGAQRARDDAIQNHTSGAGQDTGTLSTAGARCEAIKAETLSVTNRGAACLRAIETLKIGPAHVITENIATLSDWFAGGADNPPSAMVECVEAIREAVAELDNTQALSDEVAHLTGHIETLGAEAANLKADIQAARARIEEHERAIAECNTPSDEQSAGRAKIASLTINIGEARKQIDESMATRDQLLELRKNNEATLQDLTADVSTLDVETTQDLVAKLTVEIDALAAKKRSAESHGQLIAEYNQCIASAERATVQHEVSKELANAVRTCRETVMASLIFPIVSRLTLYLDIARPDVIPFVDLENDRGRPIFDFGWTDGTRRVSFDAMSGGERALFAAGLAFALVDIADPALKLLLLEVGEVDAPTLSNMLGALAAVTADRFQSFVATHAGAAPDGWDEVVLPKGRA